MGESHLYCTHTFEVACNFVYMQQSCTVHRGLKTDSQMGTVVKSSVTFLILYEHHTISEVYNIDCTRAIPAH